MNDAIIGILFVLFALVAYLLGYTTGRYCNGDKKHDARLNTDTYRIEQKRAAVDTYISNVRVMGKDVDPDTLLVIDPKAKNTTTTARKKKKP